MNLKTNIILIVLLLLSSSSSAQEIIIPQNRGARNAAMGDANVSEANDVSGHYLNPASLVFMREKKVLFNHGRLKDNFGMTENLAVPVLLFSNWSLAVSLESYHMGYFSEHSNFPGQQILEYNYSLSTAYAIIGTFSIGATAGLRSAEANSTVFGPYYVIGINYFPSTDINYGAAFFGLGDAVRYVIEDSTLKSEKINPNKRIVLGASMKFPSSSSLRRTIFILSLANEKIFGVDGVLYKAGIEFKPVNHLDLRFGYTLGPGISEPRIGAGFYYDIFNLEYVIHFGPSTRMLDQISISVRF